MLKNIVLGLTALSVVAVADTAAPVLRSLNITKVASEGKVLRERRNHPYTNFLVGVAVLADPGDACTKLAGQSNTGTPALNEVTVIGARNAVNDACIAVMPPPIDTVLTVDMKVLTGGFVAPGRYFKKTVQFNGIGLHEIELDLTHNTVKVKPVARRPR